MMQIPDPVHGYITLDGMYADIVNSAEFQRLRYVEQVSFRPSYPGARHDRFLHSLGTYHLATKFAESFFVNLRKDIRGIKISAEEQKMLTETFRYAALLHDVGHAPFSHTTENFFLEPVDSVSGLPQIWVDLREAVRAVDHAEGALFEKEGKQIGAAHEIVSALVLVSKYRELTGKALPAKVDLPLAARMVIGFPYKAADLGVLTGHTTDSLGVRNCLIQMLNYSTLDVDRLDYMGRDTAMTGFASASLDLACLAASVTAVRDADGWLVPAYRDMALRVFDLMFQAKLSHESWVVSSPASVYEAELLKHCIRDLGQEYMSTIFTPAALSREGVDCADPADPARVKHYRLLNDADISADLKARSGPLCDELYTRELRTRRIAAWRSYYEYRHIFSMPELGLSADDVYQYLKPLIDHLEKVQESETADPAKTVRNNILTFDYASYQAISKLPDSRITHPARTLHEYLRSLPTGEHYSIVLLNRTGNFTLKLDPAEIRIVFAGKNIPLRSDNRNYSTYSELTGVTAKDRRSYAFFYLFRHSGLGSKQLPALRKKLAAAIKDARKKNIFPVK